MHIARQMSGKPKIFPLPHVFIDEEDQWIATMMNLAHLKVHYCSGANKDPAILPDVPGSA